MVPILMAFFLLLFALSSGLEIAFVTANKLKFELRKKKGDPRTGFMASFFDQPFLFVGAMMVASYFALTGFTNLAAHWLEGFFPDETWGYWGQWAAIVAILTFVVLLLGELIPHTLFRLHADAVLITMAYPIRMLIWVFSPMAHFCNLTSRKLAKVISGMDTPVVDPVFTRLDLERFVMETGSDLKGEIVDREMFGNALSLKETRVRECMVPRPEIEYIDIHASVEELEALFKETKLSRILVIEDEVDNVLGYVHHQQLLDNPRSIRSIRLDIRFVPEVMRVSDLLHKFISERVNIVCVVDEFGGVAGIITLEDILEEIFGEIEDEHDEEEYIDNKISDSEFLLSGRLEIDYLNEKYPSLQLPEGEYHTLSGYLVMTTGHIPQKGDQLALNGWRFILEEVSDTKIETVRILK